MAVFIVSQFRVHPGKTAAFTALLNDVCPILERHGARIRVLRTVFGGPDTQVVSLLTENEDMASHGRYMAAIAADPDFQAWGATLVGADPAATLISNSVLQDQPLQASPA